MDVFPIVISRLILDFLNIDEQNYIINNWKSIVNVCDFSAKHGFLKLLKWARSSAAGRNSSTDTSGGSQNCNWHEWTCTSAAKNSHLELFKWVRSSAAAFRWLARFPLNTKTCVRVAENNHLELLKWAVSSAADPYGGSQGCHWDDLTYALAAMNGHLELLQWARSSDDPSKNFYWNERHAHMRL